MWSRLGKLFARILFIPVTAFFLHQALWIFRRGLLGLIDTYPDEGGGGGELYIKFSPLLQLFDVILLFWAALHFALEIVAYFKTDDRLLSCWLRHLRYAPIAALIFSGIITFFFRPRDDRVFKTPDQKLRLQRFADGRNAGPAAS